MIHVMNKTAIVLALLAVVVLSGRHVQLNRFALPPSYQRAEALMVSPVVLEIIAGDFKSVVADYLFVKASYFVGGVYKPQDEDWEAVAILFEQSLQLDPYFFSVMYYAQGVLVWIKDMPARVVTLLEQSHRARFWDWEPGFYLGFDYFYFLSDTKRAAEKLQESAQRPDAPSLVPFLAAKMSQQTGNTETSIHLLKVMYEQVEDENVRIEIERRIKAYQGILVLEEALQKYTEQTGRFPGNLQELVASKKLKSLPDNPYYDSFYYEPASGAISYMPFQGD